MKLKYVAGHLLFVIFIAVLLFSKTALAAFAATSGSTTVSGTPPSTSVTPQPSGQATCTADVCPTEAAISPTVSQDPTPTDSASNSATVTATPSATVITPTPVVTKTPKPSGVVTTKPLPFITPDPTIMQMRQQLNTQVSDSANAIKENVKKQAEAITLFVTSEVTAIQDFFSGLFK